MFHGQKINEEGSLDLDIREIVRDDSKACVNFQNHYNNEKLRDIFARQNRYKRIEDMFFEQVELNVKDGMMYLGFTFDDLYLGRPQNWKA